MDLSVPVLSFALSIVARSSLKKNINIGNSSLSHTILVPREFQLSFKREYVTKELELDHAMDQKFYEENLEQIKIMMRVINELFGDGISKYEDIIPTETTGYYNN